MRSPGYAGGRSTGSDPYLFFFDKSKMEAPAGSSPSDYSADFEEVYKLQEQNRLAEEAAAVAQFEREQTAANAANAFSAEQAQLNRDWQTAANEKAMQFEADQARINREWQAQQTNTAYQRAVADLKAAGLNPILAAMGSGAASAAGAQASGVSSAGATAAASKASASKASVDTTTYREILNTIINGAFGLGNSLIKGVLSSK